MTLPNIIDFAEADHPELMHVFHDIDAGIAAIIASDPSLAHKPRSNRRARKPATTVRTPAKPRRIRRAAA